jgi:hypothetical protein
MIKIFPRKLELIKIFRVRILAKRKGDLNPNEPSKAGVPLPLCYFKLSFEFDPPFMHSTDATGREGHPLHPFMDRDLVR